MIDQPRTKLHWDTDVVKHYVRKYGWLPAAKMQAQAALNSGRSPKYLSFCASEAVDIFLFLREGILKRNADTNVIERTYFCEDDPTDFGIISQLIGAHEQGFYGNFQEMILFEDDDTTQGLALNDIANRYSSEIRSKLSIKDRHQRFRSMVPFDIINLDPYGTFFPPKGDVLSPMLRSVRKLLDWQTEASLEDPTFDSFTLFLTSHVEDGLMNDNALEELVDMVNSNGLTYAGFSESLMNRFGTSDALTMLSENFTEFFCVALPKLVVSEAFGREWLANPQFAGLYRRERLDNSGRQVSGYSMLAWVVRFTRHNPEEVVLGLTETRRLIDYTDVINRLTYPADDVDLVLRPVVGEIAADLGDVRTFRDDYLTGLRSGI